MQFPLYYSSYGWWYDSIWLVAAGDIKGYENRLALDAKSQLGRAKDLAPGIFWVVFGHLEITRNMGPKNRTQTKCDLT